MSETVDVPAVGRVKTPYAVGGLVLAAGIVGYAWWRRSRSTSDAAPDFYADTRTGSELPTDKYTNPAPSSSSGDSGSGERAPTTDVEWAQRVVEKLTWYEPAFVSATVGKYLARQALTTSDEQTLIREAWAQVGHPPGNQPIITAPTGPPSGGGTPGPTLGTPTGLHAVRRSRTQIELAWSPAANATGYVVHRGPAPYATYNVGMRTGMGWMGLAPDHAYTFSVHALGPNGQETASSVITARTTK